MPSRGTPARCPCMVLMLGLMVWYGYCDGVIFLKFFCNKLAALGQGSVSAASSSIRSPNQVPGEELGKKKRLLRAYAKTAIFSFQQIKSRFCNNPCSQMVEDSLELLKVSWFIQRIRFGSRGLVCWFQKRTGWILVHGFCLDFLVLRSAITEFILHLSGASMDSTFLSFKMSCRLVLHLAAGNYGLPMLLEQLQTTKKAVKRRKIYSEVSAPTKSFAPSFEVAALQVAGVDEAGETKVQFRRARQCRRFFSARAWL